MTAIEDFVIQQVKKFRIEHKLSQQAFADYINVSQGFIRDCESPHKRAKYNINHLNEIVKVFNCKFAYFFQSKLFNPQKSKYMQCLISHQALHTPY